MANNFPVDQMFEQPGGWLRAVLPKIMDVSRSVPTISGGRTDTDISARDSFSIFQKKRWHQLSGSDATDTKFSIIIPVHNEERSLPSFLGALFLSEIPVTADVLIVFVINASTDGSLDLIKRRLAWICPPAELILPESRYDTNRSNAIYHVRCKSLRFFVVETPTPGKANALNLGNEIMFQQGYRVAINIDANNWVEPDSIALMYRKARETILSQAESDVVIINSKEYCPTRHEQTDVSVKPRVQKAEVTGCMFAWDTHWIEENHGFPQKAVEDYGTGLLALSQNKVIAESDAKIWVFTPSNPFDENRQMIRFIYGAMQLAREFADDPRAISILLEDFPHLRPIQDRFRLYFSRKARQPFGPLRAVFRWLFNEFLIFQARRKLRKDPHGQTWEPIRSTK